MARLRWGWMLGISQSEAAQRKGDAIGHVTTWKSTGPILGWRRNDDGQGDWVETLEAGYFTPCGRTLGLSGTSPKARTVTVCKHCASTIAKVRARREIIGRPIGCFLGAYWMSFDVTVPPKMTKLPKIVPAGTATGRAEMVNRGLIGRNV